MKHTWYQWSNWKVYKLLQWKYNHTNLDQIKRAKREKLHFQYNPFQHEYNVATLFVNLFQGKTLKILKIRLGNNVIIIMFNFFSKTKFDEVSEIYIFSFRTSIRNLSPVVSNFIKLWSSFQTHIIIEKN